MTISLITLASLGLAGIIQLQEPCSQVETLTPLPPCGSCSVTNGTSEVTAQGRHPRSGTREERIIDGAKDLIKDWESDCPNLPKIPVPAGVLGGNDVPVSEALDGQTFCIEQLMVGEDDPLATVPPSEGQHFGRLGQIQVFTGTGIGIHRDVFRISPEDLASEVLAIILVHEAFHLLNPWSDDDTVAEKENAAYEFQFKYLCALMECLQASGEDTTAMCDYYNNLMVLTSGVPFCMPLPPPCPACPEDTSKIKPSWGNGVVSLPNYMLGRSENVFFSAGIGGGLGMFALDPLTKMAQANLSYGASGQITIDFSTEIPGFQPTAFHRLQTSDVQSFGIAGFDETTGDGMLVKVDLDFTSNPSFAVSVIFSSNLLGKPLDIFAFESASSKIFVLEDGGTIKLIRLIGGTVTTLATVSDAAGLNDCMYIYGQPAVEDGPPGHEFYDIIASQVRPVDHRYSAITVGPIVHCFDTNGDGVFEEIREL